MKNPRIAECTFFRFEALVFTLFPNLHNALKARAFGFQLCLFIYFARFAKSRTLTARLAALLSFHFGIDGDGNARSLLATLQEEYKLAGDTIPN